ncbi:MAG TPA: SUF system NifU family Fe-S cluster assembly protein [Firmicutes bacterium]|nr:SUF system NifU family Fe-S cluster assembly protein [Bacillota bacterium]
MSLDELYREVIMDHYRSPRHWGRLTEATDSVHLHNPLCGDDITLDLMIEDGRIKEVGFEGKGCSISQASASLMAESIAGKSTAEAVRLLKRFRNMMKGAPAGDDEVTAEAAAEAGADAEAEADAEDLGDLEALSGVVKFPVRIKCAVLPWEALRKAIAPELNIADDF